MENLTIRAQTGQHYSQPRIRVEKRIVSYTVVSRASKPIIRRRRVVLSSQNNFPNDEYPWEQPRKRELKLQETDKPQRLEQCQQTKKPQRFKQCQETEKPQRFKQCQETEKPQLFEQYQQTEKPQRFQQCKETEKPQRFEQCLEYGQSQRFRQSQQYGQYQQKQHSVQQQRRNYHHQQQQLQQQQQRQKYPNRQYEELDQQPYVRELEAEPDNDEELEALEHLPDRVLMFNKRDPVSVLMEYGQTREVKISFTDMSRSGPHHASRFHTAAIVDGETHVLAMGTSKKNAKKAAAIMALRTMYDRGMIRLGQANDHVNIEMKAMDAQEPMSHSTKIMQAARRMLEVAEETQFINYSKDKVLAAIVLERRGKYTVAGLGTGNRCIQYQNMAADGSRIIHSHAEVIARRAFKRFALRELCSYTGTEKHPLFTRSRHTGLIKLHDDIKVHLYISRPPCGDAAAFPTITNFPNRMRAIRKQGQLRTIIDDGEGAIPTDFPLPANANGKERLRVMTCSDKILRWNGVGIQGALLSNFLDPIYLNSLVIGSHTGDQRGHVPRAISGRLKCGRLHEVLMKPFRICSPEIVYPPCSDNYAITKSKQYCITWSEGDPDAEVIDAVTGAVAMEPTDNSPASRVSKRALLGLFRTACDNLNARNLVTLTYAEAKQSARAYQRTKRSVEDHLLSCGFGQWLKLQESYGTDNFEEHEKLG